MDIHEDGNTQNSCYAALTAVTPGSTFNLIQYVFVSWLELWSESGRWTCSCSSVHLRHISLFEKYLLLLMRRPDLRSTQDRIIYRPRPVSVPGGACAWVNILLITAILKQELKHEGKIWYWGWSHVRTNNYQFKLWWRSGMVRINRNNIHPCMDNGHAWYQGSGRILYLVNCRQLCRRGSLRVSVIWQSDHFAAIPDIGVGLFGLWKQINSEWQFEFLCMPYKIK